MICKPTGKVSHVIRKFAQQIPFCKPHVDNLSMTDAGPLPDRVPVQVPARALPDQGRASQLATYHQLFV